MSIRVKVDPTNPGQFFACCGLLELADRLWQGAEGWFENEGREFCVRATTMADRTLEQLLNAIEAADLVADKPEQPETSPLKLGGAFDVWLDWWKDDAAGGGDFKTWAGRQKVTSIASAMRRALPRAIRWASTSPRQLGHDLLQYPEVIPDPDDPKKSVVPFYFDARRAAGAMNLDIGFSPDVQGIDATSFPTVEYLCLIGLQRFRPWRGPDSRKYRYNAWQTPLPPAAAWAAVLSAPPEYPGRLFEYRLLYRTKYLKGFLPATPLETTR